jgi:hypothetical protein
MYYHKPSNPSGSRESCPPNSESIPKSGFLTNYDHCRFRKVTICDNCGDTKESLLSLC